MESDSAGPEGAPHNPAGNAGEEVGVILGGVESGAGFFNGGPPAVAGVLS
jgi:hypothetical protein